MPERAGVFETTEDFDVTAFAPKQPSAPSDAAALETVRQVSESMHFRSRDPQPAREKEKGKPDRRHRTGRNIQLNTKVDLETNERLYRIHAAHKDAENWTLGQIIGLALQALERELETTVRPKR